MLSWEHAFVTFLLASLLLMYVSRSYLLAPRYVPPCPPPRAYDVILREPEYYDESAQPSNPDDAVRQALIDFSDVMISDEQRQEKAGISDDTKQIQSVNERFDAAKRSTYENKMRVGVYNNKERRRLIEKLLRRPYVTRRVRSWRTENSDILRGDVRPVVTTASTNILRSAKSNPDVDLHPGALGPLAGKAGLWLSEADVPDNVVEDIEFINDSV
jgi:hypothetical protein